MGEMYVYAGKYNSPTSIDVVVLMMMDQAAPMSTGTYQTIPVGTTKMFQFMFAPAVNPSDTAAMESVYMLTSGSATISTLSSTAAAGTFSGSGFYLNNGIPVPTQTINVTNGSFNVPLLVGEGGLTVDQRKAIEKIARRMISHK
jgi:hypothetical protein